MKRAIIGVLTFLAMLPLAEAQVQQVTIVCFYQSGGVALEIDRSGQWEIDRANFGAEGFKLVVTEDGAKLIGGQGVSDLVWIPGGGSASHLVEVTPTGVNLITIYSADYTSGVWSPFVQTRHLDLNGPLPQMYFGVCTREGSP